MSNRVNMMKYYYVLCLVLFLSFGLRVEGQNSDNYTAENHDSTERVIRSIWTESSFRETVTYNVFLLAMKGYYKNGSFKTGIISIVDYSKPSTEKRFYVIDLNNKTLLFHTLIAHGKNSGANKAKSFSNQSKSLKSSIGFFKTSETYFGKHGYSLKLDGLEKGINDNARKRAIVIHGAAYVSLDFIKKNGRLGRSWGCPALPLSKTDDIVNTIKNGTCVFIYYPDEKYLKTSKLLNL